MGDNFFISLNMSYGAGCRSTDRRSLFKPVSMSAELSALRQRVDRLEELFEAAAGGEEALGERLYNHETWLKEISPITAKNESANSKVNFKAMI